MNSGSIAAVILDFDGVVIDSVDIKDRAFASLLPEHPTALAAIMAYHFAHNDVDRYAKFRHIAESILGIPYTTDLESEWRDRFERLTHSSLVTCPYVPGALEFLDRLGPVLPIYLASATPDRELAAILNERDLRGRFTGVYGSSTRKSEAFAEILRAEHIPPRRAVFVGDSPEDERVADTVGLRFIGRSGRYNFPRRPSASDMCGVLSLLEKMDPSLRERADALIA